MNKRTRRRLTGFLLLAMTMAIIPFGALYLLGVPVFWALAAVAGLIALFLALSAIAGLLFGVFEKFPKKMP